MSTSNVYNVIDVVCESGRFIGNDTDPTYHEDERLLKGIYEKP